MIPTRIVRPVLYVLTVGTLLWHFYIGIVGVPEPMISRPVHVALLMLVAFMTIPAHGDMAKNGGVAWYDVILGLVPVVAAAYIAWDYERIVWRIRLSDPVLTADWVIGIAVLVTIFEMTRRVAGWTLPILAAVLFVYTLYGPIFPGTLYHPGVPMKDVMDHIFLTADGMYGGIVSLSLSIVFMFIAFGAFLEFAGGDKLLSKIISSITRNTRGGPAKGAVIGSALFGSISGSGPANVFATGTITIPLMKKNGFKPEFAAGLEAVASQIGQLIPPVMGTAAFLVAEFSRVPYSSVAASALLPALLYVYACYFATHLETERQGIGIFRDPSLDPNATGWGTLREYGHILFPMAVLIYMMADNYSPYYAATVAAMTAIPVSWLRAGTRMSPRRILMAFDITVQRVAQLAPVIFMAGIIIAILQLTGVPYAITAVIIKIGGGNLFAVLMIIAALTIFLGFGLPVTGAFLIAALFGASALTELGVSPFVAYMYIFMFALMANVTPPVCLATFAAASIAETSFMRAGWLGMKIGLPAYITPVMVVYNPTLLNIFEHGIVFGVISVATALVGITAMVSATFGWMLHALNWPQRIILFGASIAFLNPGLPSDLGAAIALFLVIGWQYFERRSGHSRALDAAARNPDAARAS
jgi:TRAP transporter 4TM/12TM fusion protein